MAEAAGLSISQGNFISTDPDTCGFDLSSGAKWIYPENYPRRDYQFNIVQTALYNNTLVCLPTGLGKTFIAAVVMYNFWRWYPRGRVVFLAPTKPLVAQQINACHEIMGIPSEQSVELTGTVHQTKRAIAWAQKRVIFATPQTFQKDLQNDYVPYEQIKCIVMDEAHKALGKHSYCEIIRMLSEKNKFFRVLALSATPGSKIDHVRQVIQNLLISELELRDDTSPDITPYTNDRSIEKIIVNLDRDLNDYKNRYLNIMDPHVRILIKNQILQGSAANISKGRIFMLMKQYESRPNKAQNHGTIMKTLNILLTMYHAYELLLKHGLRAFHHFYLNHSDKFWLDAEIDLNLMLEDIKKYIGDFPVIQPLDDGSVPDVPEDLVFGHSKFKKLQDLLVNHFQSFSLQNKSTRAIVFVEYRDIVNEVYVLLLQKRPLIRPQMFVGQAGQKQKQQLAALEDFRNNKVNVLISTSVGEEGLDVGEVDLIVCFDISTSTPTRLVQRMGRTGRKRSGRVVLLLTEGKEVQTLNQAMSKKDSLNSKVLQSSNIASSLYQSSPRMVPQSITPECRAMFIKALPKTPKARAKKVTKPPAEKKPRNKAKDIAVQDDDDCLILPSTSNYYPETSQSKSPTKFKATKDANHHKSVSNKQPSMMKFLTDQRQPKRTQFSYDTDSGFAEDFQLPENRDNPYSFIRPHEVKLLTSDSHALEFLTLCAMKKSEKESSTVNHDMQLNLKWVPPRSPPRDHAFHDLKIPSMTSLDCIRNLALSEMPPKSGDDDDSFFPDKSRLARIGSNLSDQSSRKDEGIYDDVLADAMEDAQVNVEISASDFCNTFIDDKRRSIVVSSSASPRDNLNGVDISEIFCSFGEDKAVNSTIKPDERRVSQSSSSVSAANVEVDFENLLDECTESEASGSPSILVEAGENIFDDLLEGGSSTDEDLFAEEDVTLTPGIKDDQDENATVREKRCASASPRRDSPPKKPRLSHVSDSSDNESTVMGTPPDGAAPPRNPVVTQACQSDSEEDFFDGLDMDETLFSDEEIIVIDEEKTTVAEPSVAVVNDEPEREKSASPVFNTRGGSSASPVFNTRGGSSASSTPRDAEPEAAAKSGTSTVNGSSHAKACSSSGGWISAGQSQTPSFSFKKPGNVSKISAASTRPKLQLSNLQVARKTTTTTSKDQDGFAVPTAPKLVDKENRLPVWRERLETSRKDGEISPRFRRYRSESDLCSSIEKARKHKRVRRHRPKARKRIACDFIEDEAGVSSDCDTSGGSSADEKHEFDGDLEDSFVSYTQDVSDAVDMRAHYLQTIGKSPVRSGAFLIKPVKRKVPDSQIFSQPVSREEMEESYLHDSFCVGDETQADGNDSSEAEESILEQIESSLESRRRKMRREREKKRFKFKCLQKNKKDTSHKAPNDSSEDETEVLRKQIMEESMMLKR